MSISHRTERSVQKRETRSHHLRVRAASASATVLFAASAATVPPLGQAAPATAAPSVHALRVTNPGTPGIPQAPTTVFSEDFENRGPTPVRLTEYAGVDGQRYTAGPSWLRNCNGWVASESDPFGSSSAVATQVADCDGASAGHGAAGTVAWNHVLALAQALGALHNPPDEATNHAVSAFSNGPVNGGNADPGDDLEFSTAPDQPIQVSANRFLTMSANLAEQNCDKPNHAQLMFYLADGATDIPVTSASAPIDPCDGTSVSIGGVTSWIGTFTGDTPVLFTGSAAGLKMLNSQESGDGNDHAFDDITLLDVTPQLDMTFAKDTAQVGDTTTLTYTITNTNDLLAKNGWSFTNNLPPGLVLASAPTTDCPSGIAGGTIGGSTVSMSGNLAPGEGSSSCTVTVEVTSNDPGTYTNDASNITDSAGLNPPASTEVTFTAAPAAPETSTELTVSPTLQVDGRPVTLTARVTCSTGTATGTVDFRAGGTSLGTAPLSDGVAHLTVTGLGHGRHDIVAVYNGSQDCPASQSGPVTVTIVPRQPPVHPRPPVRPRPPVHPRPPVPAPPTTVHVTG